MADQPFVGNASDPPAVFGDGKRRPQASQSASGAHLVELDSGREYYWDGSQWHLFESRTERLLEQLLTLATQQSALLSDIRDLLQALND